MSEEKVGIVYNACYGGFSVSDAAVRRYAELKGITLYPEKGPYGLMTYWTKPRGSIIGILHEDDFHAASLDARAASNRLYAEHTIDIRCFDRTDPILVKVVEELGAEANGRCADLAIQYVPKGTLYRIDEYDGRESVVLASEQEWSVA